MQEDFRNNLTDSLKSVYDSVIKIIDEVEHILEDYEFIIRELRNFLSGEEIDNGTMNFLEDLIMKKEKDAWKIRSNVE